MDHKDKSRKNSSSSSAASMAALAAAAAAGDGRAAAMPSPMEEDKKPRLVAAASPLVHVAASSSSTSASASAGASGSRGGGGASSSSSNSVAAAAARRGANRAGGVAAGGGGGGGGGPRCQVERCGIDLSEAGRYNRRHKVCAAHSKEPVVLVAGLRQRFCQQCSRKLLAKFNRKVNVITLDQFFCQSRWSLAWPCSCCPGAVYGFDKDLLQQLLMAHRFHELTAFDDAKRSCRHRLAGHNERRRKSSADANGHGDQNCRHADHDGRGHPGSGNPPFQIR